MSDAFYYFDDLAASEPKTRQKPRTEQVLHRIVIALAVILFVELIWFFALIPCMPFSNIDIHGIEGLNQADIMRIASIDAESTFMNTKAASIEQALERVPQIESASVIKKFPDSLSIELTQRSAVALAIASLNGKAVPVYFDRYGVVFNIGDNLNDQAAANLPILSGLVFEQARIGMRLPDMLLPLLDDVYRLQQTAPELLGVISEIRIQSRPYDGYDIMIYPAYRPVRVRMGSQLNEDSLRYMMLILDVLASKSIEADEIDFRTGTVAYRTKEASSG